MNLNPSSQISSPPSQVDLVLPVSKVHFDLTSLLSTLAHNAVIMETRGLTRCLLNEATTKTGEKETVLNTEGINMHEMFKHSDVSVGRIVWLSTIIYRVHR